MKTLIMATLVVIATVFCAIAYNIGFERGVNGAIDDVEMYVRLRYAEDWVESQKEAR